MRMMNKWRKDQVNNGLKSRVLRTAVAGAMLAMIASPIYAAPANNALPTNGVFMGGAGAIDTANIANGVMNVNQTTQNAAIKWDTFNVGANATINFTYNNAMDGAYKVLNFSQNGGLPSEIFGRMRAGEMADVWLVNPNGVLIGKGAQIDVGYMHLATHNLTDAQLGFMGNTGAFTDADGRLLGEHTIGEVMSLGNLYVNQITFDGDRVVIDFDKLHTFDGKRVKLGEEGYLDDHGFAHENAGGTGGYVSGVYVGANDSSMHLPGGGTQALTNNTTDYAYKVDATITKYLDGKNGHTNYLEVSDHARELVAGYTVYDKNATSAHGEKGSYENSGKWRGIYAALADGNGGVKSEAERVGFAWVEDSTQLERIGEGVKTLARDYALKDGIAAINTREMNGGAGFKPIGYDTHGTGTVTPFTGKFDGLGYDIYGLTVKRPNENDVGLFGSTDGAIIRNVSLVSGSIVGNEGVGGIVGHANNTYIENVRNSARVLGVNNVGGIAGYMTNDAAIDSGYNAALIRGNSNVGGIVGKMDAGSKIIGDTYNTGAVRGIVNYKLAYSAVDEHGNPIKYDGATADALTNATYAVDNGSQLGSVVRAQGTGNGTYVANQGDYNLSGKEYKDYYITDVDITKFTFADASGNRLTLPTDEAGIKDIKDQLAAGKGYTIGSTVKLGGNEYSIVSMANGAFKYTAVDNPQSEFTSTVNVVYSTSNGYTVNKYTLNIGRDTDIGYNFSNIMGGGSENVGGIAGVMNDSSIGNSDKGSFTIYNGVDVHAGHDIGGIVGSMNNSSIENVSNKGNISASSFFTGEYIHYTGENRTNGVNLTPHDVNIANVGGIVGSAGTQKFYRTTGNTGLYKLLSEKVTADPTNIISNVSNSGNVSAGTDTKKQMGITQVNSGGMNSNTTPVTFEYYTGGNVGGIAGSAIHASIDGATNTENKVFGAHNVGGIAGTLQQSSHITDSINDGGRIIGTGAINGNSTNWINNLGDMAHQGIVSYNGNLGKTYELGFDNVLRVDAKDWNNSQNNEFVVVGNIGGIAGYLFDDKNITTQVNGALTAEEINNGVKLNKNSYLSGVRNRGDISAAEIEDASHANIVYDHNMSSNIGGIVGFIGKDNRVGAAGNNSLQTLEQTASQIKHNAYRASVDDAANTGTVSGFFSTGGVAGRSYNGEIANSYNMGNVKASVANISGDSGTAINLGGVLGDGLEYVSSGSSVLYNVYNAGTIGDSTYTTFGRHMGGLIGRFNGLMANSYNTGDIYNSSDTTGGLVGYVWGDGSHATSIKDSFNAGNITVLAKHTGNVGTDVGGLVGSAAGAGSNNRITNAYNIGVHRVYRLSAPGYSAGPAKLSGISERNSNKVVLNNVYSTGELYTATITGFDTDGNPIGVSNENANISAIAPSIASGSRNLYYIKPATGSGFAEKTNPGSGVTAINYDDRYDATKYAGFDFRQSNGRNDYTSTTMNAGDDTHAWRMYQYDVNTGATVYKLGDGTYNTAADGSGTTVAESNVRATLPTLNALLPGGYMYYKPSSFNGIKYTQIGNEYNPVTTFVQMNNDNDTLNLNFKGLLDVSMPGARDGIVVNNGNLNITKVDSDKYFSGIYGASGDVTINGTAENLNVASDAAIYGKNVTMNNAGDINILGNIYAYDGDVNITGNNVDIYGSVLSGSKYYDDLKWSDGTKLITESGGNYTANIQGMGSNANGDYQTTADVTNPNVSVLNKGYMYQKALAITEDTAGNIAITADPAKGGNVNLAFGNSAAGRIRTDGDVTVKGKDVKIDADMTVGLTNKYTGHSGSTFKVIADKAIFDVSNVGSYGIKDSLHETKAQADAAKARLLQFISHFTSGSAVNNHIEFKSLAGGRTDAKLGLSMFGGYDKDGNRVGENELNLTKYNSAGVSADDALFNSLKNLNVSNGDETKVGQKYGYIDITNAEQLKSIQTYMEKTGSATPMKLNFMLRNNIDASDITDFHTLGVQKDGAGNVTGTVDFTGKFDGNGYDLNSLTVEPTEGNAGLFATIGTSGVVSNLNINASRLQGNSSRIGLVAGTNKGIIDNVSTFGNSVQDRKGYTGTDPRFIGGLVGLNTGSIDNVSVEDVVYSENATGMSDVGGISGLNAGVIYDSMGKSDASVADGGASSLGGITGVNAGVLAKVQATGVTSGLYDRTMSATHDYVGAQNVGGIAGENRTVYATRTGNTNTATGVYKVLNFKGELTTDLGSNGGVIQSAYNDSQVTGWSNVGGIIGTNYGAGDEITKKTGETTSVTMTNTAAASASFIANAATVTGGDNVGGIIGVNNGSVKATITGDATDVVSGRNTGKVEGTRGMLDSAGYYSTGTNVGGLIGIAEHDSDVQYLLNGKAASVYGFQNVGGIIGRNEGLLRDSKNMMEKNDIAIAGIINVGGSVGENAAGGIMFGIKSDNEFNIIVNEDYYKNGAFNKDLAKDPNVTVSDDGKTLRVKNADGSFTEYNTPKYFGGVLGYNAPADGSTRAGIVADAENRANVMVTGAEYVGGIIGRNEGTLGEKGQYIIAAGTYKGQVQTTDPGTGDYYKVMGEYINHGVVGAILENGKSVISETGVADKVIVKEDRAVEINKADGTIKVTETYFNAGGNVVRTVVSKYLPGTSDYVGGIMGRNDSVLHNIDLVNHATGSVMGKDYVGGIVGGNYGTLQGERDANSNFYDDQVYNNGAIVATGQYAGGIAGDNTGSITLAYNTGTVMSTGTSTGLTTGAAGSYVGGIVGKNEGGTLDQVFSSLTANDFINGKKFVGGAVGENTGTISNAYSNGSVTGNADVGNLIGANNAAAGTVTYSYSTGTTGKLIGSGTKGGTGTYSYVDGDTTAAGVLDTEAKQKDSASYVGYDTAIWKTYDGASTPILKNFLTNVYYSGALEPFTYIAQNQGIRVVAVDITGNGKLDSVVVMGSKDNKEIGRIYAVDENGRHTMDDFLGSYGANNGLATDTTITYTDKNGNTKTAYAVDLPNDLVVGNNGATDAGSYNMFTSQQIKAVDNQVTDGNPGDLGVNNLGYLFVTLDNNPTDGNKATAPLSQTQTEGIEYVINRAVLTATAEDIKRIYGNTTPTEGGYNVTISGWQGTDANTLNKAEYFTNTKNDDYGLAGGALDATKTNNVNTYKWTGTTAITDDAYAGALKNYTFQIVKIDGSTGTAVIDPVTGKPVMEDSRTVNTEAASIVERAKLKVEFGSFDVVYGQKQSTGTILDGTKTIADAEKYNITGLVNGDDAFTADQIKTNIINTDLFKDEAFKDTGLTKDVGSYVNGAGQNAAVLNNSTFTNDHVTGGISLGGNYDVEIVNGNVNVVPKQLTVTAKDVTRDYGTDTVGTNRDTYVNIEGFVAGEEGLKNHIDFNRTSDGAVDLPADHKIGQVTNDVNTSSDGETDYTWAGNLGLNADDLKNYTFGTEGQNRVTTLDEGAKSYVTPQNITLTVEDLTMIYGAQKGDKNKTATVNNFYAGKGETVYTNNVESVYNITTAAGSQTYNGDKLSDIINNSKVTWTNGGFVSSDANAHTQNVNVDGPAYGLTADTSGAHGTAYGNYNVILQNSDGSASSGDNVTGNVTVKHAILTGGVDDVYRYYGSDQKYQYDQNSGALVEIPEGTYPSNGVVTGFVYGEGSTAVGGKTWADSITIVKDNTIKDGAVTGLGANQKTNNVDRYTWTGGKMTIEAGAKDEVFNNYRFWDVDSNDITTDAEVKLGANSYVIPQKIVVDITNNTITYGDRYDDSKADLNSTKKPELTSADQYKGNVVETAGGLVNGDSGDWKALLGTVTFDYIEGADKAFTSTSGGVGRTNNANGNGAADIYLESIQANVTGLEGGKTFNSAYTGNMNYTGYISNNNYEVEINKGSVKINPKELEISDLHSIVNYGQAGVGTFDGMRDSGTITGGVLSGIVYDDNVHADYVAGTGSLTGAYEANRGDRNTADVNRDALGNVTAYDNAMSATMQLNGAQAGNYVFKTPAGTDKSQTVVKGDVTVNPVHVTVTLNDFKVLYGDINDGTNKTIETDTTDRGYHRTDTNVSDAETHIKNATGLVNGDEGKIDEIIGITGVNNNAFIDRTVNGIVVQGTANIGDDYNLGIKTSDKLTATTMDGNNIREGYTNNYIVNIIDGSVDVIKKDVQVIDPHDPDAPDPAVDKDVVYVYGNDVERIYGNTTIDPNSDTDKDDTYKVKIDNLAAWEEPGGSKVIEIDHTKAESLGLKDEGLNGAGGTNNAGDHKWTVGQGPDGSSLIATIGGNYDVPADIEVTGGSKVNKADLVIQLGNLNVDYGTKDDGNLPYTEVTLNKPGTTYGDNHLGLAQQDVDKGLTYDDLFSYDDGNTGYNADGSQKDAFTNGAQNHYTHYAQGAKGQGDFTVSDAHGGSSTGTSVGGNYNVTILNGDVTFNKAQLTVTGNDVNRTYGDKNITSGEYTGTINDGLAEWHKNDTTLDKTVDYTGHVGKDEAVDDLLPGKTTTNNAGDYTWTSDGTGANVPDWIANNYELPADVTGDSHVDKAQLVIDLNHFEVLYGDEYDRGNVNTVTSTGGIFDSRTDKTIGSEEAVIGGHAGLVNGDENNSIYDIIKVTDVNNSAFKEYTLKDGTTVTGTKNVGTGYEYNAAGVVVDSDKTAAVGTVEGKDTVESKNYVITINKGTTDVVAKPVINVNPKDPDTLPFKPDDPKTWPTKPADPTDPASPQVVVPPFVPDTTDPNYKADDPTTWQPKKDSGFDPTDPTTWDPEIFDNDPDRIYVVGNDVERTYGDDTIHTTPTNVDGDYGITIHGQGAKWEDPIQELITLNTPTINDGGLDTSGKPQGAVTNNAGGYTWEGELNVANPDGASKPNYTIVPNGDGEKKVIADSTVNKAQLVVNMNNFTVLYGDKYDDNKNTVNALDGQFVSRTDKATQDEEKLLTVGNVNKPVNGDDLSEIIKINSVNNEAFVDHNGIKGTADVNDPSNKYGLTANTVKLDGKDTATNVTGNKIESQNYEIVINKGNVDVVSKPIITVDSNNPPADFDPDKIYVIGNDVERTYGDPTINPNGKDHNYGISIKGEGAAWDKPIEELITLNTPTVNDGGLDTNGKPGAVTNNAGDYNWTGTVNVNADKPNNYNINANGGNGNTVIADSTVNKAQLVINLDDYNVLYGDIKDNNPNTIVIDPVTGKPVRTQTTVGQVENNWQNNAHGMANGDNINDILIMDTTTNAFIPRPDGNGSTVNGTNNVGSYGHIVGTNNMTGTGTVGNQTTGVSNDGNYHIVINHGTVGVVPKPVVVVTPNNPMPEEIDPDKIYVIPNRVERDYGNTNVINKADPDDPDYNIGIIGTPVWDMDKVIVDLNRDPAGNPIVDDGALSGSGQTTNPAGSYEWQGTLNLDDNYQFDLDDVVIGESIVNPVPIIDVPDHFNENDATRGDQRHWRERKAETNFYSGGGDFFNTFEEDDVLSSIFDDIIDANMIDVRPDGTVEITDGSSDEDDDTEEKENNE